MNTKKREIKICVYLCCWRAKIYYIYTNMRSIVSYRIIDENNVEKTLYDVVAYSADLRTFFLW